MSDTVLNAFICDVQNWQQSGMSPAEITCTLQKLFSAAPRLAAETAAAAVHRLAAMQPGSGAYPPRRLFVAEGHTGECAIGTDLPGSMSMTCSCGAYWRDREAGGS